MGGEAVHIRCHRSGGEAKSCFRFFEAHAIVMSGRMKQPLTQGQADSEALRGVLALLE